MPSMPPLEEYRRKRKFDASPEPKGQKIEGRARQRFVVQEHHARRVHYDLRLEVDGVLKSWAVPKGPSLNPADKRLAVQTEDHPLEYLTFKGVIPEGNYGAGLMTIWDHGTFQAEGSLSASEQIRRGELKFTLNGQKLHGSFVLVKVRSRNSKPEWLLIKHRDGFADPQWMLRADFEGKSKQQNTPNKQSRAKSSEAMAKPKKVEIPSGARPAPMPRTIRPALASLTERPFSDPEWLFEIKWDGVRTLAAVREGRVRLWSRSNREITSEYPELSNIPQCINAREVWLDGEAVVLDDDGRSDFQRLQLRFSVQKPSAQLLRDSPVVYYVFDVLYFDGYDLRGIPLIERKTLLRNILRESAQMRFSDHVIENGTELYELAVKRGLEGLVAKRMASSYPEGRTSAWLKIKLVKDIDVVIGGWTDPRGSRDYFGALLMGLYGASGLQYIGSVGTGFPSRIRKKLWEHLQKLKVANSPFVSSFSTREKKHWVDPILVARVQFSEWTDARQLRAPRFKGLLEDRDPKQCIFEEPTQLKPAQAGDVRNRSDRRKSPPPPSAELNEDQLREELTTGSAESVHATIDGRQLHFTNLNKVFFPEEGYTKRDLLAYYYQIASIILPFLKDRPLVLRRYPNGIQGEAFFQKDAGANIPEWIRTVPIHSEDKVRPIRYILANDRTTLLYLANWGCIDHNPWSSRHNDQDHPDYIFFDLDPTEGTSFTTVIKLARLILGVLDQLGFKAFAKTSGATGIHIFLPIEPRYSYEQARMFVQAVADMVNQKESGLITSERTVNRRARGSVYVDARQNSRGQSLASVYSVRAFPHAPVSVPLRTNELQPSMAPEKWNLKTMPQRLKQVGDLWADFWNQRQRLEILLD